MLFRSIIAVSLILVQAAIVNGNETPTPKGFRSLFNQRNLQGWYGWNPHASQKLTGEKLAANLKEQREDFANHWRVEHGELVNAGTGPYATTEEEFGDIELHIEYKTVAGADSGIYLRGNPQVQIWDINQKFDPKRPDRRPFIGSGGLFNNDPKTLGRDPLEKMDRPFGQWNSFRIKIIGDRVWVDLNGRPVVIGAPHANFWKKGEAFPAKGPIMLQTHGGEIRWRNIFVREISAKEAQVTLAAHPVLPNPTHYELSYGPHAKQAIHYWRADSKEPTPLLLFIHGGGWSNGSRLSGLAGNLNKFLDNGISVASVEYRNISEATEDGVEPPVKAPLHDAARALQFLRSKANELGFDKTKVVASGGSAGAASSLWLAFHDDLADPKSEDPISRESTRLAFAAVSGAQTTLDPKQMREWTPNSRYGAHAFGIKADPAKKTTAFDEFISKRDAILPWIESFSAYHWVSQDDPPVYLFYDNKPALGQEAKDPTHSANFGVKLQEHAKAQKAKVELYYPGVEESVPSSTLEAVLHFLGKKS